MRYVHLCIILTAAALGLAACADSQRIKSLTPAQEAETSPADTGTGNAAQQTETMTKENSRMQMTIGTTPVTVDWQNNASVEALNNLVKESPLSIQMSMYGGFEQVGPIGSALPANDSETTTSAGDIVLYSGNQIVVFYASNSWAYTRLGHISSKTPHELEELLGSGDTVITIAPDN